MAVLIVFYLYLSSLWIIFYFCWQRCQSFYILIKFDIYSYDINVFTVFRYGGLTFGEERKAVPESFENLPYDDIKRLYSRHAAKVTIAVHKPDCSILFDTNISKYFRPFKGQAWRMQCFNGR